MTKSNTQENLSRKTPVILSHYQNLLDSPASARQLGKSQLSKMIMEAAAEWHGKSQGIPKAWVSTEGHCNAPDVDSSELYPKVPNGFKGESSIDKLKRNMISGKETCTSSPLYGNRDLDLSDAFGNVLYKPELVVDENNVGNKAKPTKVFYYTEEDLEMLSEKFKANLVTVTLTDDDKN